MGAGQTQVSYTDSTPAALRRQGVGQRCSQEMEDIRRGDWKMEEEKGGKESQRTALQKSRNGFEETVS